MNKTHLGVSSHEKEDQLLRVCRKELTLHTWVGHTLHIPKKACFMTGPRPTPKDWDPGMF